MILSNISRQTFQLSRRFSQILNEELKIIRHDGDRTGIFEIGLNRPKAKNAFSISLFQGLQSTIQKIKYDQDIRVIIIRSLIPGIFSAGADLKERLKFTEKDVIEFVTELRNTFQDIADLNPAVIAALDGVALGGGLELALACDIRVASNSAKLGLVETKIGTIPGAGGTQRLARIINPAFAKELIFTAKVLNGEEAYKIGLVNHVVDQNESGDAAYVKAIEIAEKIIPNAPVAVKLAKRAINKGLDVDLKSGLGVEESVFAQITSTKDRVEGLLAFQQKRVPNYKGE